LIAVTKNREDREEKDRGRWESGGERSREKETGKRKRDEQEHTQIVLDRRTGRKTDYVFISFTRFFSFHVHDREGQIDRQKKICS